MRIEDTFAKREIEFNTRFNKVNSNKDTKVNEGTSFASILKETIDQVNNKKLEADAATSAFVKGEDGVSIDEVMIKGTEASLGLQFLTQVRDKLLEGYNELSKMQL